MPELRVWWIPQVPGKMFTVFVANFVEAKLLIDTLAAYDAFQFKNNIKPDYCNAGGLNVMEDGEWVDWHPDEQQQEVLLGLFGPEVAYDDEVITAMSLEDVRRFQAALDSVKST